MNIFAMHRDFYKEIYLDFPQTYHLDDSWLSKKEKKKRRENKRKRHNCQLSKFINRTSKRQNRDSETQL